MAKAVFTTKVDPVYDDLPENRYHFPPSYLNQVQSALNDWIVYYEPRRTTGSLSSSGGRQSYFAVARVTGIKKDPKNAGYFYAFVDEYLEFDRPVPFREGDKTYENQLTKSDGSTNKGAFGRSVRNISDFEFDLILTAGYSRSISESLHPIATDNIRQPRYDGLSEAEQATYHRPVIERLVSRPFRDIAFVGAVKDAYLNTCAMTGLKIINGGGRAEVQAAHIKPVAEDGPDSVRNGLALSGTIHWMFDRNLISIDEDYSILVAKDKVPDTIGRMLNLDRRLILPKRPEFWPHAQYLKHHRQKFKG